MDVNDYWESLYKQNPPTTKTNSSYRGKSLGSIRNRKTVELKTPKTEKQQKNIIQNRKTVGKLIQNPKTAKKFSQNRKLHTKLWKQINVHVQITKTPINLIGW